MIRRILPLLAALLLGLTRAHAVLNEKDLAQSLSVLRVELRQAWLQQRQNVEQWERNNERQHRRMLDFMQKSGQVGLMIYSQKDDYVFDLTYACHEATQMYRDFQKERVPYDRILVRLQTEVDRYKGLVEALETLPPALDRRVQAVRDSISRSDGGDEAPFRLDARGIRDREECLKYARELLAGVQAFKADIERDNANYKRLGQQLRSLNDYATLRYKDVQNDIFRNAGDNYFALLARLPQNASYARRDVQDKYGTSAAYRHVDSEWSGRVVWGYVVFVLIYLVLAIVLSYTGVSLAMRRVRRLQTEEFRLKRVGVNVAAGAIVFALSILVAGRFLTQHFYVMASDLLVEYAWLLAAIYASLLVRMKGEQMSAALRIYLPIVLAGLVVIVFRIVLIPGLVVSLLFPPLVLAFTAWQWVACRRQGPHVPRSDRSYAWMSLLVMGASSVCALVGYTLLAVEAFIWWLFQLTAIQTIALAFSLLRLYEDGKLRRRLLSSGLTPEQIAKGAKKGDYITQTWFFDLFEKALVPIAAVYSVLLCIYLAADVFDLSQPCYDIFMYTFLDVEGVIQLSLFKIVVSAALFFVFRYLAYALKALYRHLRMGEQQRKNADRPVRADEVNLTLGYNLINILAWGIYAIAASFILKIPKSGISLVTAGLATGLGFAMKDILNNFFYGIQLMTGRLRVGDYIECDGIQGRVESITYQSTQIITPDDCVMAFLNSTLFSKNFKNLTRNHSYELIKLVVGVAYGTDVAEARCIITAAVGDLQRDDAYGRPVLDPSYGVSVSLGELADSSVNLSVVARVLVPEKVAYQNAARESIYNALNRAHIEIPFPQRDVHLRKD